LRETPASRPAISGLLRFPSRVCVVSQVDLGVISRRYYQWREALPRITPFYAVKCCPDPAFLQVLATLGSGFDVASQVRERRRSAETRSCDFK